MTLRARLALGLVIIAGVLIVPLVVARRSMQRLHGDVSALREGEFQASLILGSLRDGLSDVRAREVALGVVKTDTVHAQLQGAIMRSRALADSLDRYGLETMASRIRRSLTTMGTASDAEFVAVQAGNPNAADSISQNVIAPALRDAERALSPAEAELRIRTRNRVEGAEEALAEAERVSLAALAIALLLATAIALWLTRSISEPVFALEEGMRAVADGELHHDLAYQTDRRDEFGRLATSFRDMSQQLAELDKLKAEFVSIASHELKTPINVILGYLQLMEDGVYGPVTAEQLPILRTVETQAKTLGRLASQLLDVSRFEAGGGRLDPRPIKLAAMLDDLEGTFHVLAVQKRIDYRVTRRPGLPVEVVWDAERINEVTGNLLSNAFKFTPTGGRVELIAAPSGTTVRIEVRDTGAGIPSEQLPKIFQKFYQADNQLSASHKGTGLGLAIAKEIVEAHQGEITCQSAVNTGTTFAITLPIAVLNRRRTGSHRIVESRGPAA